MIRAALLTLLLPATLFAQADPKKKDDKGSEKFLEFILGQNDTNKDGKIAKSEAKGKLAEGFERIDTNKDGFLDRGELRVLAQRFGMMGGGPFGGRPGFGGGPDFDALDKNADGRLTPEELRGSPLAERFTEIDADKSGEIDRREFASHLKKK